MWQPRAIELITFRAKAARGQLALTPIDPALTFYRQRLVRFEVPDDFVDLGAPSSVRLMRTTQSKIGRGSSGPLPPFWLTVRLSPKQR
jgi:hypothetical protein